MNKNKTSIPKVTIVGRPNVGKSSLFNRIIKDKKAIVYSETGTTRDTIDHEVTVRGKRFILTDTGGFIADDKNRILSLVKSQINRAIDDSDILLFVCDGQTGPLPEDFELSLILRKADKKVILVVNKVDNDKVGEGVLDFYQMGLDKPYPVSALHNLGTGELMDEVVKEFPDSAGDDGKRAPIKIALVGRPNVGKSSFVNCLLNEERVIVDEVPGTTRDSVDTYFRGGDTEFILIDTAGLRHKRKVKEAVDIYSSMRSKDAIRKSDVCLVLIDGYDGLVSDDLKILEFVMKEGKFCILCVNKWDLIKGVLQKKYEDRIYERAAFLRKYPVVFTSVKNKYNVTGTLERVKQIIASVGVKIPTPELNKLLVSLKVRGPFSPKSNRLRIQYGTQIRSNPPTFLIFVNDPKFVSEVHVNYIENNIRDNFGFFGMPVRFEFRGAKGG